MEIARIIVAHTPLYVWAVLALLVFLGVRRLKPRRTHLALAALAPAGFLTWSAITAGFLVADKQTADVAAAWVIAFLAGAITGPIRTVSRPTHVHGWLFDYVATWQPLAFYMLLFGIRYGLGIWAGFEPARADALALAGLALSSFTAGRTLADFLAAVAVALRARGTSRYFGN